MKRSHLLAEYLKSRASLVISTPYRATAPSVTKNEKRWRKISVKLNQLLNDFQLSVAQEALGPTGWAALVLSRMPLLGYRSPIDVMKRM